jgi:hypothetical protein
LVDLKKKKVGVGLIKDKITLLRLFLTQSPKIVLEHFEIWLFGAVLGVFWR